MVTYRSRMQNKLFAACVILGMTGLVATAAAAPYNGDLRDEPRNLSIAPKDPLSLKDLQELNKSEPITGSRTPNGSNSDYENLNSESNGGTSAHNAKGDALENIVDDEKDLALKIRRDSMREAALSFGARGGLAFRTKMIMRDLDKTHAALDRVYDFRRLLIKAPSNMYIEPPIISEALNNFIVTPTGDEAAVADTIYHISRQARIVSAPRSWHQYLDRTWSEVIAPPDILLPENAKERAAWRRWIAKGWEEGYHQADEIFQSDLNRLIADFEGMVRYRVLLTQNKITAPYATMVDRGVTGERVDTMVGSTQHKVVSEMRIGDRAIRITQPVSLQPDASNDDWTPPIQAAP